MILLLAITLLAEPHPVFVSSLERAFTLLQSQDWNAAAAALDEAYASDPGTFTANNLHYLRGRLAADGADWNRARDEFSKIARSNPLRPLAAWHTAKAWIQLGDAQQAEAAIRELPADFPADLRIQLARSAPPALAVRIYDGIATREARFRRAVILGETRPLWTLIDESNADDFALESARLLAPLAVQPRDLLSIANTFLAHRQFDDAIRFYRRVADTPALAAEASYQIGRAHFLRQDYAAAIETFRAVAANFSEGDWRRNSESQIAAAYWRLRQYPAAEQAYLDYIARSREVEEGAIRDLADIYRAMGEPDKAVDLIDRTLARPISTAGRQVLLFTKAKVLYALGRYGPALEIFRQLGQMTLQSTPNATSREEARYFEALSMMRMGNDAGANTIFRSLAADPLSYYGLRSAERLGARPEAPQPERVCNGDLDSALSASLNRLQAQRRPVRTAATAADAVSELMFMQLWDEASLWIDRTSQPDARMAADLAYAAGRYHRAIAHADRLAKTETANLLLFYPAGYRRTVCEAAAQYGMDTLWLHAIIWQESKYNTNARSPASARGLMQFIPDTALAVGARIGMPDLALERLYDPAVSIRLGAHYWNDLLEEFGHPALALAAYNGGSDNVRRWRDKWPEADIELFVADIGFQETKRYVQIIFGVRDAYGRLN